MYSLQYSLPPLSTNIYKALSTYKNHPVCANSRLLQLGDIFMAYQGEYSDGRQYIQQAIDKGALAIVYEQDDTFRLPENITIPTIAIPKLREYAGIVAAYLLNNPAKDKLIIGVTGTNGKTSIAQWLAQALDKLGQKCAITGTAGNGFWGELYPGSHTTADAVTVQNFLSNFDKQYATAVTMEVSSHGLVQYRVVGVPFETAILTNLTRDHLDYHKSTQAYAEAKAKLFYWASLKHAIINIDDNFGQQLIGELKQNRPELNIISYGFNSKANIQITQFQPALSHTTLQFKTPWGITNLKTRLLGRFNALNLASCIGVLCSHQYDLDLVSCILEQIQPAHGRMDSLHYPDKPLVIIDYAHTPDALEKVLSTLQEIKPSDSHLWCVFGCGGNRDKGKRPLMGKIAVQYADHVIVTSDNPRFEEPQAIIDDILVAVTKPAFVDTNRQNAIGYAITHATDQDIILIAGKGHESYQEIQGIKYHFDDFQVAKAFLQNPTH